MSSHRRALALIASILATLPLLAACGDPSPWGVPGERVLSRLASRDYSFLDAVDQRRYEEVLSLGPEGPWYMARHLSRANRPSQARAFLELGAAQSPEPFKTLCMQELAVVGSATERLSALEALERHDSPFNRAYPAATESARLSALVELRRFDDIPGGLAGLIRERSFTPALAEAVTTLVEDQSGTLPSGLTTSLSRLAALRLSAYRRDYRGAWTASREFLSGDAALLARPVLSDIGRAALYGADDPAAAAVYFEALESRVSGEAAYMSAFYAGRLRAKQADRVGRTSKAGRDALSRARASFERAVSSAPTHGDRDAALWYLLETRASETPAVYLSELARLAPSWHDRRRLSGIVDSLVVSLARARDWKAVARLDDILPADVDPDLRARVRYMAARSGALSGDARTAAYTSARDGDHDSLYYRVLAGAALGLDPDSPVRAAASAAPASGGAPAPAGAPVPTSVPAPADAAGDLDADMAAVLRGYARWGLPGEIASFVSSRRRDVPFELAIELSALLASTGSYSAALRTAVFGMRSPSAVLNEEYLRLLYPRPWGDEVASASRAYGVPEYLLFALIRSESFFDPSVTSHAGAIGLTQLMPATAADVAARLKVAEYDLTDPATNIAFGSWYLSKLIERLDGKVMPALFAYNAGITRVRSWMRETGDLPGELFLETLPYEETREYGRKVLAAAVVYGYLYYDKTTGDVVRELF